MTGPVFFCGVGGSGMSALALVLLGRGVCVYGSDRSHDKGESPDKFQALRDAGVKLFPQDGSGISADIACLVVSSAVEKSVPDVAAALDLGIVIKKRAEILAEQVNGMRGICIGGTSGKTTVTGMVAHMLYELGFDPTFMNGGQGINFIERGLSGNAHAGKSELFVTETDESDGSIALFAPAVAVLNNITLDHKPLDELRPLFSDFVSKAREAAIINLDDPEAAQLVNINPDTITFSRGNAAADIVGAQIRMSLQVPGDHNISNALAALCVARALGIPQDQAIKALESFKGIKRRFEIVGTQAGITVIDDFGHNPDKIEATLKTLKESDGRVIAIFQPHGFGPTRMLRRGLVESFAGHLGDEDILIMPEIYYAGGTADKSISSADIIDDVTQAGKHGFFIEKRSDIPSFISDRAKPGDRIVVMGARDDTLSDFAREILRTLKKRAA